MNLPPFSHAFYSSPSYHPSVSNYHSPPGLSSHLGLNTSFSGSSSAPPQQSGFGSSQGAYNPNGPSSTSPSAATASSSFPRGLPVPASGPRGPHSYNESPRLGPGPLSYSSSPGLHHLSPTSPTTQMMPAGLFSHSTNSSSASSLFPNPLRTPGGSKRKVEHQGSASPDGESWDESDKSGKPVIGEETDERPWGMPQDQYKQLNPRDKKQVRNRIGARRFRAKRKGQSGTAFFSYLPAARRTWSSRVLSLTLALDYVGNLEASLRTRDGEISSLRDQVDSYRNEINDLRSRLGMPALSPRISNSNNTPGLGLLMGQGGADGWGDVKDE